MTHLTQILDSSWDNNHYRVNFWHNTKMKNIFFWNWPIGKFWVKKILISWNFLGPNMWLRFPLKSESSQIFLSPEKLRQKFTFQFCKNSIFKWKIWPKHQFDQIANCQMFFCITVNYIIQELNFCLSLSGWGKIWDNSEEI